MTGSIERSRGTQAAGTVPRRTTDQAVPAGGAAATGDRPATSPRDGLTPQRGAATGLALPSAMPPAAASPVPPYGETFGSQSYVKDGSNPAMVALMSRAVAANPDLANGPLGKGLGRGEVGPEQVKALQTFLESRGYHVGSKGVDGKFGPNTHAALAGMLNGEPPSEANKPVTKQPENPGADPGTRPVDRAGAQPTPADAGSKTAVYDVSAGRVTLPDGTVLEAHSGRGAAQDDPRSSNQRNRGTTPVGTYKLTPREARFHGTAALRLTPISGNQHGRDGFLAHNYMLGPKGESHGCVVFKNYPAFLKAYNSGQINQIKIVE